METNGFYSEEKNIVNIDFKRETIMCSFVDTSQ